MPAARPPRRLHGTGTNRKAPLWPGGAFPAIHPGGGGWRWPQAAQVIELRALVPGMLFRKKLPVVPTTSRSCIFTVPRAPHPRQTSGHSTSWLCMGTSG